MVNVEQGSDFDIGVSCRVKRYTRCGQVGALVKTQSKPSISGGLFVSSLLRRTEQEGVCVSWGFGTFLEGSCFRITLVNSYPSIEKESPLEAPAYVPALP